MMYDFVLITLVMSCMYTRVYVTCPSCNARLVHEKSKWHRALLCFSVVSIVLRVKYERKLPGVGCSWAVFVSVRVCLKQKQKDFQVLFLILVRRLEVRRSEHCGKRRSVCQS